MRARARDIAETAPAHDPIGPNPVVRAALGLLLGAAGGTAIVALTGEGHEQEPGAGVRMRSTHRER